MNLEKFVGKEGFLQFAPGVALVMVQSDDGRPVPIVTRQGNEQGMVAVPFVACRLLEVESGIAHVEYADPAGQHEPTHSLLSLGMILGFTVCGEKKRIKLIVAQ